MFPLNAWVLKIPYVMTGASSIIEMVSHKTEKQRVVKVNNSGEKQITYWWKTVKANAKKAYLTSQLLSESLLHHLLFLFLQQ